jgi:hypothetical protein
VALVLMESIVVVPEMFGSFLVILFHGVFGLVGIVVPRPL